MLAVFIVNQAPPASADHGRTKDVTVWSGTLSPAGQTAGTRGCFGTSAQFRCTGKLSPLTYTVSSTTYQVEQLTVSATGYLFFKMTSAWFEGARDATLVIGNTRFAFSAGSVGTNSVSWTNTGLNWGTVNSVQTRLLIPGTETFWTGVDLYGGNMVHQADGYQYMNINEGGSNGTFWVRLDQAPTANVTITIGKLSTFGIDDFDAATVSPQTLTFTTGNWQTGQQVTVSAATDGDGADDRIIISASVSIDDSADPNDPYRNPERVNGFVLTVKDTTVGGG